MAWDGIGLFLRRLLNWGYVGAQRHLSIEASAWRSSQRLVSMESSTCYNDRLKHVPHKWCGRCMGRMSADVHELQGTTEKDFLTENKRPVILKKSEVIADRMCQ